jgi:hypothetical protein
MHSAETSSVQGPLSTTGCIFELMRIYLAQNLSILLFREGWIFSTPHSVSGAKGKAAG